MQPKIKICGMRDPENVKEVAALAPDYMGFIYYAKSPRYVGPEFRLRRQPETQAIRNVAVFVNEPPESALEIAVRDGYDAVQLHGAESPAYCKEFQSAGFEVIKAFGIDADFDFAQLEPYAGSVNFFLFDAKTRAYGGSGKPFEWEKLGEYTGTTPFFLSGGLEPANLEEALAVTAGLPLYALDLNSRVETAPGIKDLEKTAAAISLIKHGKYEN